MSGFSFAAMQRLKREDDRSRMKHPLKIDEDEHRLKCPWCTSPDGVHVSHVRVVGLEIDAQTGTVSLSPYPVPLGSSDWGTRIAITGWCEFCDDRFNIVFADHKGAVFIDVVQDRNKIEK